MVASISTIIEELSKTLLSISYQEQEALAEYILNAKHIFVAGCGRSGMAARCFAMRLMHMGLKTYMVGEVVTPAICEGDLLIIASGSGTTASLVKMAEKAKAIGAKVATLTIYPEATIGQMADSVVTIKAATPKSDIEDKASSVQPMGSLFEQALLICLDYTILILMDKKNITGKEMFLRHANLE